MKIILNETQKDLLRQNMTTTFKDKRLFKVDETPWREEGYSNKFKRHIIFNVEGEEDLYYFTSISEGYSYKYINDEEIKNIIKIQDAIYIYEEI